MYGVLVLRITFLPTGPRIPRPSPLRFPSIFQHLQYLQQTELILHGLQHTEQHTVSPSAYRAAHGVTSGNSSKKSSPSAASNIQSSHIASPPAPPANRAYSPQPPAYRVAHSASVFLRLSYNPPYFSLFIGMNSFEMF